MTQSLPSPCDSCLRRRTPTTCEAFPEGIPEDIVTWGDNHAVPVPGQANDLAWVFRPGAQEEFDSWREFQEAEVR